jgi:hypothetical protein
VAIKEGQTYYFLLHAYHHFIGTVVEITGKKECVIKNVRRVQSSQRGWTDFFAQGAGSGNETVTTTWPDGMEISGWFAAVPWNHPIPGDPAADEPVRR